MEIPVGTYVVLIGVIGFLLGLIVGVIIGIFERERL